RLFSLPGKIFVGGISYATSQQFLQWQLNNSAAAPVIPVDMVSLPSLCSIPWSGPTPQECR
ncbi:MAG: hypothetical protein Q7T03_05360, partial [Deltaproteobacteria bacterium]|nr:hypothetical protein [Deltaproteobacteria bacterium]